MLKVDEDKMNQDQQQTEDVATISPSLTEANTLPSSSYILPKLKKDAIDGTPEAWLIGKLLQDLEPEVGSSCRRMAMYCAFLFIGIADRW